MPHSRCLAVLIAALALIVAPRSPAQVDPSTPKGALRAFYQAMEAGDAAAVRASFHTATDAERQLADAYAAQLTAAKALGDAAKAKFAAAGDSLSKGLPARDELARLDAADVKSQGDRATVRLPGQARTLTLVRSEGHWQIALADFAGGGGAAAAPDALSTQATVLNDMAGVFQSVAADITADKFATATDAQRALQKKLQAILFTALQKSPPTTAPSATQSATQTKP